MWDSWVWNNGLDYSWCRRKHEFYIHSPWFSLSPKYHGAMWRWVLVYTVHKWVCTTAEEPQTQEIPTLIRGLLANKLNICPREKHYLYYTSQETNLLSAPEGDNISIFQGCLFYRHPWKDSPGWKLSQAFKEKWENHRKLVSPEASHPILASPFDKEKRMD